MYKNKNSKKDKQIGFTLIELVIVMAMIAILGATSLKLIKFSDTYRSLNTATAELKGFIRTAQNLSLAPPIIRDGSNDIVHVCGFVVRATANSLRIDYVKPSDNDPETCLKLTSISQICDAVPTTNCESVPANAYRLKVFEGFTVNNAPPIKIFFKAPYGKVIGGGDISISQDGATADFKRTVTVNEYGMISSSP